MENILLISSILLWIVLIINLLIIFALVKKLNSLSYPDRQIDLLENGQEAPHFIAETLDGRQVRLDNYTSEFALVFVSPNCGPCSDEMLRLDKLYSKAKQVGVELSVISLEDSDSTRSHIRELEFNSPILVAPRGQNPLSEIYKVPGLI